MTKALLIFFQFSFSTYCFALSRDTIRTVSTSTIDGVKYKAVYYASDKIAIKKPGSKPVLTLRANDLQLSYAGFDSFQFTDFNYDGYKDLLITYIANVPDICDLLLYNHRTHTFKQVRGFEKFPEPIRIPHTTFYYSYHASGCADANWDSDLFKIVNFKAIRMGNIQGLECGGKEGIFITKIRGQSVKMYKQQPISTINHYKNYKGGFIKGYWIHHYKEFK